MYAASPKAHVHVPFVTPFLERVARVRSSNCEDDQQHERTILKHTFWRNVPLGDYADSLQRFYRAAGNQTTPAWRTRYRDNSLFAVLKVDSTKSATWRIFDRRGNVFLEGQVFQLAVVRPSFEETSAVGQERSLIGL